MNGCRILFGSHDISLILENSGSEPRVSFTEDKRCITSTVCV